MGKVTFSSTFKEKERKNIYKKEEILFFASKCKLEQIPQWTPGPNFSQTTYNPQGTNVYFLPSQQILLTLKWPPKQNPNKYLHRQTLKEPPTSPLYQTNSMNILKK